MTGSRQLVLLVGAGLFLAWLVGHLAAITGPEDGMIRLILGLLFCLLILMRWKKADHQAAAPISVVLFSALAGTAFVLGGLIFHVHQFEWLGLIVMLYACLRWSLPPKFGHDILLAMFLLYWVHPLPGNIFGGIQMTMQALSVKSAEWLLQSLNIRVWADGVILHSGGRVFEVAEACSGLRTGVTVLLCTVGVGVLFRLRWFEVAFFGALGLAQVMLLNVLRIAFMVVWSARKPPEWSASFLHDTLGLFLLVSILLVQLQMSWWNLRRTAKTVLQRAIETGDAEPAERATMLPAFWRVMVRWGWLMAASVLVAAGVAFELYQHRPAHRAAMITGVIEDLIGRDVNAAERAVAAVLRLDPSNRDAASRRAHIMILREHAAEALGQIDRLAPPLTTFETIMKSWALMGLGRGDEAAALLDGLPESARGQPTVAIIRAEYAAQQNQPEVAARQVEVAARSHASIDRARRLFPFLALHEQWGAIAKADNPVIPFRELEPALVAIHAHLKIGDMGGAADALKRALARWPNEPRFLSAIFLMAASRPGSEWEDTFERVFKANVATLDADRLVSCIDYAFRFNRPDLAWMAYLRVKRQDPADPALFLAPAQFGDIWFTFRKRRLGLESGAPSENTDLRALMAATRHMEPLKSFWDLIPLGDELAGGALAETKKRCLQSCFEEIQRREKQGTLTKRMEMTYPLALTMAARYPEAHASLDAIRKRYPERTPDVLSQQAMLYDSENKWQECYEAIREFYSASEFRNLSIDLLMVKALLNMDLGVNAMEVAERSKKSFPGAPQFNRIAAAIWGRFGFAEQALFLISRDEAAADPLVVAQLLFDTGRFQEAQKAAQVLGVRNLRRPRPSEQTVLPRPAELSIARMWPDYRADADVQRELRRFEQQEKESASPFMKALGGLGAEWYRERGAVSDPARWKAAGRDDLERGAALNVLTTLLACQRDYDRARAAAEAATTFMPRSAMLWRVLIALSGGDRDSVKRARAACPDDPEIWLASLVTRTRDEGPGAWALQEIQSVTNRFAAGTLVQAGVFLLRQGMPEPASIVARTAIKDGRGLVSAYALGLLCALTQRDYKWAETCVSKGADLAEDPTLFYEAMVGIRAAGKGDDADTLKALEYLQSKFPEDSRWAEKLGAAYFARGDTRRTLNVLIPVVEGDIRKVGGQALLLAAEAARQQGKTDQAIGILESAYKLYPDRVSVLNNLVYHLAQDPKGLKRAVALLPKLLEIGGESAAVMDTAATVYLKSGQLDVAAGYMEKALKGIDKNDYAAQEINLNAAEVMFRSGDYDGAKERLGLIRRDPKVSPLVDNESRELLKEIEKTIRNSRK